MSALTSLLILNAEPLPPKPATAAGNSVSAAPPGHTNHVHNGGTESTAGGDFDRIYAQSLEDNDNTERKEPGQQQVSEQQVNHSGATQGQVSQDEADQAQVNKRQANQFEVGSQRQKPGIGSESKSVLAANNGNDLPLGGADLPASYGSPILAVDQLPVPENYLWSQGMISFQSDLALLSESGEPMAPEIASIFASATVIGLEGQWNWAVSESPESTLFPPLTDASARELLLTGAPGGEISSAGVIQPPNHADWMQLKLEIPGLQPVLAEAGALAPLGWAIADGDYWTSGYVAAIPLTLDSSFKQLSSAEVVTSLSQVNPILTSRLDFSFHDAAVTQAPFFQGPLQHFSERLSALLAGAGKKTLSETKDSAAVLGSTNNLPSNSASSLQIVNSASEVANAVLPPRAQELAVPGAEGVKTGQTSITVPFSHPNWSENFAQQITLIAGQRISSAQIQLDPPELGPLLVRIDISGEQATINFVSQHGMVRDALEHTIPRLEEMLAEEGFNLLNVNISDQQLARQSHPDTNEDGNRSDGDGDDENPALAQEIRFERQTIVDFYV